MKKKYINFFIRITISIFIIVLPLIITEIFLNIFSLEYDWIEEDKKINQMNIEKLQNSYYLSNGLWLHKNEKLKPKEEGKKRILIVGDSYVWGDGYSNANHIWWQQLKLMLKQNGYNDVEIVACGIPGYSTYHEFEYILKDKELIQKIDPDFIIIGYVPNDPSISKTQHDGAIFLTNSDFDLNNKIFTTPIAKKFFPRIYFKISNIISEKYTQNEKFEEKFGVSYLTWIEDVVKSDKFIYYENNIIKPMKEYILNEIGVPFLFYINAHNPEEICRDEILNMFERNEISCYFLPYEMQKNNISTILANGKINPVNWHPGTDVTWIYATCMLKILQTDYSDIIGQKSGEYVETFTINDWMPYSLLPEKTAENSYIINYPSKGDKLSFLTLPVKKDYIKLNLEEPMNLDEIKIEGENIEDIQIWINTINEELGYDDQVMHKVKKIKDTFIFNIDSDEKITSINIHADIKDGKQKPLKVIVK